MGPDFNILEYADPELDKVTGGEKTNIFDDLEDEDEKKKHSTANMWVSFFRDYFFIKIHVEII